MIPLQPVFHRDGKGDRNEHHVPGQAHLLDAVVLGKAHGIKHGGELSLGVAVVSGRLQQLPHAGNAGIGGIVAGKRLGVLLRQGGKNLLKFLVRDVGGNQAQGIGEVAHAISDANAAGDALIIHLIPVNRHGKGIVDALLPGGVEVVYDHMGFQIVSVGGVGHWVIVRLGRCGKGHLAGALIQDGHVRGFLIQVQLQLVAAGGKLIILVACQLLLFQHQLRAFVEFVAA